MQYTQWSLCGIYVFFVITLFHLQKQNDGIVMINFYNDYVTCSEDATLQDVAGSFQII